MIISVVLQMIMTNRQSEQGDPPTTSSLQGDRLDEAIPGLTKKGLHLIIGVASLFKIPEAFIQFFGNQPVELALERLNDTKKAGHGLSEAGYSFRCREDQPEFNHLSPSPDANSSNDANQRRREYKARRIT